MLSIYYVDILYVYAENCDYEAGLWLIPSVGCLVLLFVVGDFCGSLFGIMVFYFVLC